MILVMTATTMMPYIPKITDRILPRIDLTTMSPNPIVVTKAKQYQKASWYGIQSLIEKTKENETINETNPKRISKAYVFLMIALIVSNLILEKASLTIAINEITEMHGTITKTATRYEPAKDRSKPKKNIFDRIAYITMSLALCL